MLSNQCSHDKQTVSAVKLVFNGDDAKAVNMLVREYVGD